jgi:predicted enzyme related to lactoylglutathione lyase
MANPFEQHGAFSWCELMTTDPAAATRFYTQLLGWETEDMAAEGMTYTVVKAGGEAIGGIMGTPPGCAPDMPSSWGAYVTVADVDQSSKRAEELGATVLMPPREIPGVGRFCVIRDPQGATLSLITYAAR